jgi:hypothetical protein
MEWQGYFYIENLGLNAQQKSTLVSALQSWGQHNDAPNPRDRNHWRVRLDGEAVIFEAVFEADNLTVPSLRSRLANLFGVNAEQITVVAIQNKYGELAVFSYNNVDRLRVGVFAGLQAGYAGSQAAAQQFIIDFATDWQQELP